MPSTQTPIVPADLGRFADVSQVEANSDRSAVAVVVSTPDLQANRYRSTVVVCAVRAGESADRAARIRRAAALVAHRPRPTGRRAP